MSPEIRNIVKDRGITRLCHFTPSRNLAHIAAGRLGILSTMRLEETERSVFNPTDLQRFDNHKNHICCTIEYPNAWYFTKAKQNDVLFQDWVVLLIKPDYLWEEGTKFSPVNAAKGGGRYIAEGVRGFKILFENKPLGSDFSRSDFHLPCCPTDQQSEILVPDAISIRDIIGVVVRSENQAKTERSRLRLSGVNPDEFVFVVVPDFFDKYALSGKIRGGVRPAETIFRSN